MSRREKTIRRNRVEKEIMKEVAEELDLPFSIVEDMVINGQSAYTVYVIRTNNFESIRWPLLGLFRVKMLKLIIKNYSQGMDKVQKELFLNQVKQGNVLPVIPRWVIKKGLMSEKQKKLLALYGEKIVI